MRKFHRLYGVVRFGMLVPFEEADPIKIDCNEGKSLLIEILQFISFPSIPRTTGFGASLELRRFLKFVSFLVQQRDKGLNFVFRSVFVCFVTLAHGIK